MENAVKYKKAFLIFTIAQFFMILGLFDNATSIKAISEIMGLFIIFEIVGFIMLIAAATKLRDFNKNFFYSFITFIICLFCSLLVSVGSESTEDFTIAWSRGLNVSLDILLCISYAYFFLGCKDHFNEAGMERNAKRCRFGFFYVIIMTILINLMAFIGSFNAIKTNYLLAAIFKYGGLAMKLAMYLFMFIILVLMMRNMKKQEKEEVTNE